MTDASRVRDPSHSVDRLAGHIERHWGLVMDVRRRRMLGSRLDRRLRTHGLESLASYADYLFNNGGMASEQDFLIDAVTTQTTSFFREPGHFDLLRDQLSHGFGTRSDGRQRLKLWSAAASIGHEPFSLAMTCADASHERGQDIGFDVLATDISTYAVRRTRSAIYAEADVDPVPFDLRRRYLMKSRDPEAKVVRVVPSLRERVTAEPINLVWKEYKQPRDFDVILIRNCLIYFDSETQKRVVTQLAEHLRPGGFLMTGHTEHFRGQEIGLQQVRPSIYRKPEDPL